MKATVRFVDGRLTADAPGMSAFRVEANPVVGRLVITCLFCGRTTSRQLAVGHDFEIRHRPDCRFERIITKAVAQHPERVGQSYANLVFRLGAFSLAVRDSLPLED